MDLGTVLVLVVAVLLFARAGLGRAVPMAAFYVLSGAWALLLVGRLVGQVIGAVMRFAGLDPAYTSGYYAPPSAAAELYGVTVTTAQLFLGLVVIVAVLLAAARTPLATSKAPPDASS